MKTEIFVLPFFAVALRSCLHLIRMEMLIPSFVKMCKTLDFVPILKWSRCSRYCSKALSIQMFSFPFPSFDSGGGIVLFRLLRHLHTNHFSVCTGGKLTSANRIEKCRIHFSCHRHSDRFSHWIDSCCLLSFVHDMALAAATSNSQQKTPFHMSLQIN